MARIESGPPEVPAPPRVGGRINNAALAPPRTTLPSGLRSEVGHLSFSQVTKLSTRYATACPRAWAYDKLLGVPSPGHNRMVLGKALDEAVSNYWTRRLLGEPIVAAATNAEPEIARVIGTEPWSDSGGSRVEYTAMMSTAFLKFVAEIGQRGAPPLLPLPASVQRDHVYEVKTYDDKTLRMVGWSDWIEHDGTIVDLKYTGTARWNKDGVWDTDFTDRVRDQLCTYYMGRLFAERHGVLDATAPLIPRGRVVVVVAAKNRKEPLVASKDFEFDEALITEVADAIREADMLSRADRHAPRPGEPCRFCPYIPRCVNDSARFTPLTADMVIREGTV